MRSPHKNSTWEKPTVYPPVRRCIYCGATTSPLGKEHIIPYGLGGSMILPRASCNRRNDANSTVIDKTDDRPRPVEQKCTEITGQFEDVCLRTNFQDYRVHNNMPTCNPDQRPISLKVRIKKGISVEEKVLPISEHPYTLNLPVFHSLPGILLGHEPTKTISVDSIFRAYNRDEYKRGGQNVYLQTS